MRPTTRRRSSNLNTSWIGRRSGWSVATGADGEAVERREHGRTLVPGHLVRFGGDVVALARRHRHDVGGRQLQLAQIVRDLARDGVEARLVEADQVDLVHRDRDLPQAQQLQDQRMAAGLLAHAFGGVDHQDGGLRLGDAGDGVLQELLVAGRVDDDVAPLRGLEEDLRGVDGDALVALGLQRVEQERPFELAAALVGRGLQLRELAFGQRVGVVQQAADQARLAVVDMADDREGEAFGERGRRRDVRQLEGECCPVHGHDPYI